LHITSASPYVDLLASENCCFLCLLFLVHVLSARNSLVTQLDMVNRQQIAGNLLMYNSLHWFCGIYFRNTLCPEKSGPTYE